MLVMSVPFTVIGAIFMAPYIRRPQLRWWIAYHVPLMFIVVLHVGFVLAVGLDAPELFFSSLQFEFPADIPGFSTLVALFVASAPLIKSRRESRAIAGSGTE